MSDKRPAGKGPLEHYLLGYADGLRAAGRMVRAGVCSVETIQVAIVKVEAERDDSILGAEVRVLGERGSR